MFIRDFHAMYVHNVLGLLWALLTPLFTVLLYSFVFSVILKIRGQGYSATHSYAVFLLAGMIPYLAISDGIQVAVNVLSQKKDMIIKTVFPAELLPVNSVLISLVGELVSLVLLLTLALYENDFHFKLMWLFLPVLVLIRLLFSLSISWWATILSVFIPDLRQILNALLPAWMFLTPILYSSQQAPEYFQKIQFLNPLAYIVDAYRAVILQASWPSMNLILCILGLCVLNIFGYWVFKALLPRAKDFL